MNYFIFADLSGAVFVTIRDYSVFEDVNFAKDIVKWLKNSKVRLLFDGLDTDIVIDKLNYLSLNLKIEEYTTSFFAVKRLDLEHKIWQDTELDWDNFRQDFLTIKVETNDQESVDILTNFLITSFGVDWNKNSLSYAQPKLNRQTQIQDQLQQNLKNNFMQSFLVINKSGQLVGCFSLTNVMGECQLSNVAGLSTFENTYQKPKLAILCSAIVNEFYTNEFYSGSDSLTFSNSKLPVATKYSNLGFESNVSRKGLIIAV